MKGFTDILRTAALAPALLLAACGYGGSEATQPFHQQVPTPPAVTVHVRNAVGTIEISTWDKAAVDVSGTKYGHDAAALRDLTVDVHHDASNVFVSTVDKGLDRGGVRYAIVVPRGASLDVENVTGTIRADLGNVSGKRAIHLRTITGAITLALAAGSSAAIVARTTVGEVSSVFPQVVSLREHVVGASAGGTLGSGSASIRLSTRTGAISLERG
jgi:hypothetical protein